MTIEPWLPKGHKIDEANIVRLLRDAGESWQIVTLEGGIECLLVENELLSRWVAAGLVDPLPFCPIGPQAPTASYFRSSNDKALYSLQRARPPRQFSEVMSFAISLRETRKRDQKSPIGDALYVEALSRLLPTYVFPSEIDDQIVLGTWMTGGLAVSTADPVGIRRVLSWLDTKSVTAAIEAAGLPDVQPIENSFAENIPAQAREDGGGLAPSSASSAFSLGQKFALPGKARLANFLNEHVVDILQNEARYKSLGIGFPSGIVLQGPPGCGKTFAIERFTEFLGWPIFTIDATSVASPYIHETSRKVAAVFDAAKAAAPSVLIIDEMEAFLGNREAGLGHHRVEEVAEFLRRIPDAANHHVLIFAMTNRVEMVDPAIIRRGRFDHIIEVSFASEEEISELLRALLAKIPFEEDLDTSRIANALVGRPLSDVAFVVREAGRVAAKSGKSAIANSDLLAALDSAPARDRDGGEKPRIGFVWDSKR